MTRFLYDDMLCSSNLKADGESPGPLWSSGSCAMRKKGVDFGGQKLNFVQIGLGTNRTFIQNLAYPVFHGDHEIDTLLGLTSVGHCSWKSKAQNIRGISVEPVAEHLDALLEDAKLFPGIELVQVAMAEASMPSAKLLTVSPSSCDSVLQRISETQRATVESQLQYAVNMSCIRSCEPTLTSELQQVCEKVSQDFSVNLEVEYRDVEVWTWEQLANVCNFAGCEVLVLDTEGYDAQILRSIISHCQHYPGSLPWVIKFESMGHCDELEGSGTEWAVICELQAHGYKLVHYSWNDSHLVLKTMLRARKELRNWVGCWKCDRCKRRWQFPYVSSGARTLCRLCQHTA